MDGSCDKPKGEGSSGNGPLRWEDEQTELNSQKADNADVMGDDKRYTIPDDSEKVKETEVGCLSNELLACENGEVMCSFENADRKGDCAVNIAFIKKNHEAARVQRCLSLTELGDSVGDVNNQRCLNEDINFNSQEELCISVNIGHTTDVENTGIKCQNCDTLEGNSFGMNGSKSDSSLFVPICTDVNICAEVNTLKMICDGNVCSAKKEPLKQKSDEKDDVKGSSTNDSPPEDHFSTDEGVKTTLGNSLNISESTSNSDYFVDKKATSFGRVQLMVKRALKQEKSQDNDIEATLNDNVYPVDTKAIYNDNVHVMDTISNQQNDSNDCKGNNCSSTNLLLAPFTGNISAKDSAFGRLNISEAAPGDLDYDVGEEFSKQDSDQKNDTSMNAEIGESSSLCLSATNENTKNLPCYESDVSEFNLSDSDCEAVNGTPKQEIDHENGTKTMTCVSKSSPVVSLHSDENVFLDTDENDERVSLDNDGNICLDDENVSLDTDENEENVSLDKDEKEENISLDKEENVSLDKDEKEENISLDKEENVSLDKDENVSLEAEENDENISLDDENISLDTEENENVSLDNDENISSDIDENTALDNDGNVSLDDENISLDKDGNISLDTDEMKDENDGTISLDKDENISLDTDESDEKVSLDNDENFEKVSLDNDEKVSLDAENYEKVSLDDEEVSLDNDENDEKVSLDKDEKVSLDNDGNVSLDKDNNISIDKEENVSLVKDGNDENVSLHKDKNMQSLVSDEISTTVVTFDDSVSFVKHDILKQNSDQESPVKTMTCVNKNSPFIHLDSDENMQDLVIGENKILKTTVDDSISLVENETLRLKNCQDVESDHCMSSSTVPLVTDTITQTLKCDGMRISEGIFSDNGVTVDGESLTQQEMFNHGKHKINSDLQSSIFMRCEPFFSREKEDGNFENRDVIKAGSQSRVDLVQEENCTKGMEVGMTESPMTVSRTAYPESLDKNPPEMVMTVNKAIDCGRVEKAVPETQTISSKTVLSTVEVDIPGLLKKNIRTVHTESSGDDVLEVLRNVNIAVRSESSGEDVPEVVKKVNTKIHSESSEEDVSEECIKCSESSGNDVLKVLDKVNTDVNSESSGEDVPEVLAKVNTKVHSESSEEPILQSSITSAKKANSTTVQADVPESQEVVSQTTCLESIGEEIPETLRMSRKTIPFGSIEEDMHESVMVVDSTADSESLDENASETQKTFKKTGPFEDAEGDICESPKKSNKKAASKKKKRTKEKKGHRKKSKRKQDREQLAENMRFVEVSRDSYNAAEMGLDAVGRNLIKDRLYDERMWVGTYDDLLDREIENQQLDRLRELGEIEFMRERKRKAKKQKTKKKRKRRVATVEEGDVGDNASHKFPTYLDGFFLQYDEDLDETVDDTSTSFDMHTRMFSSGDRVYQRHFGCESGDSVKSGNGSDSGRNRCEELEDRGRKRHDKRGHKERRRKQKERSNSYEASYDREHHNVAICASREHVFDRERSRSERDDERVRSSERKIRRLDRECDKEKMMMDKNRRQAQVEEESRHSARSVSQDYRTVIAERSPVIAARSPVVAARSPVVAARSPVIAGRSPISSSQHKRRSEPRGLANDTEQESGRGRSKHADQHNLGRTSYRRDRNAENSQIESSQHRSERGSDKENNRKRKRKRAMRTQERRDPDNRNRNARRVRGTSRSSSSSVGSSGAVRRRGDVNDDGCCIIISQESSDDGGASSDVVIVASERLIINLDDDEDVRPSRVYKESAAKKSKSKNIPPPSEQPSQSRSTEIRNRPKRVADSRGVPERQKCIEAPASDKSITEVETLSVSASSTAYDPMHPTEDAEECNIRHPASSSSRSLASSLVEPRPFTPDRPAPRVGRPSTPPLPAVVKVSTTAPSLQHPSPPSSGDANSLLHVSPPSIRDAKLLLHLSPPSVRDASSLLHSSPNSFRDASSLLHQSPPSVRDASSLLHPSPPSVRDANSLLCPSSPNLTSAPTFLTPPHSHQHSLMPVPRHLESEFDQASIFPSEPTRSILSPNKLLPNGGLTPGFSNAQQSLLPTQDTVPFFPLQTSRLPVSCNTMPAPYLPPPPPPPFGVCLEPAQQLSVPAGNHFSQLECAQPVIEEHNMASHINEQNIFQPSELFSNAHTMVSVQPPLIERSPLMGGLAANMSSSCSHSSQGHDGGDIVETTKAMEMDCNSGDDDYHLELLSPKANSKKDYKRRKQQKEHSNGNQGASSGNSCNPGSSSELPAKHAKTLNKDTNKAVAKEHPQVPQDKSKVHRGKKKRVESNVRDEDEEDVPVSAADLTCKEKFLKKLYFQERVVEEVKMAIKPFYNSKKITKEQYKVILRKAVPKVCHNKKGNINPQKILHLVEAYVRKMIRGQARGGGKKVQQHPAVDKLNSKDKNSSASVKHNGDRTFGLVR
ncbi:hypothetical protein BsWGS_19150 [Bradybaena similaris]